MTYPPHQTRQLSDATSDTMSPISPMTSPELRGVILSAGLGTRLRPLTDHYPKPLIPVAGRPLVEWGLIALAEAGANTIGINTHYRGAQLVDYLTPHRLSGLTEELSCSPLRIYWSHEETLLGTGGGLRALYAQLFPEVNLDSSDPHGSGDLVSLNGDALFDFSLTPLIETHRAQGGAVSTLALREVPLGDPFGRVGVDAQGRVVRIAEVKGPRSHEEVRVGAFTGAQIMNAEVIRRLETQFSDIFRTAHRALLAEDIEIRSHFVPRDSLWVDVGNLERYLAAHRALVDRPKSSLWRRVPAHEREGTNVKFHGAHLDERVALTDHVWIGAGARVLSAQPTTLTESVIWGGVETHLDPFIDTATSTQSSLPSMSRWVFTPQHALHHS